MNPIEIHILLWIYSRPTVPPDDLAQPKTCKEVTERFEAEGLISRVGGVLASDCWGWETTEKGRVFVENILALPLPVQKWVMPESEAAE